MRSLEKYNPDTTVEHKYGPETENKLLEEKVNINQEINEEKTPFDELGLEKPKKKVIKRHKKKDILNDQDILDMFVDE